jgi:hypothetical protein
MAKKSEFFNARRKKMNQIYETPEVLFVTYIDEDIISTSNNGINLPDVSLGVFGESEIM